MEPEKIIRRPLILTEKGNTLREQENKYLFEVNPSANKIEIKQAVEKLFKGVTVVNVHTMIVRGKTRQYGRLELKRQNWKKAVVTLKEGDSIDIFEGV